MILLGIYFEYIPTDHLLPSYFAISTGLNKGTFYIVHLKGFIKAKLCLKVTVVCSKRRLQLISMYITESCVIL